MIFPVKHYGFDIFEEILYFQTKPCLIVVYFELVVYIPNHLPTVGKITSKSQDSFLLSPCILMCIKCSNFSTFSRINLKTLDESPLHPMKNEPVRMHLAPKSEGILRWWRWRGRRPATGEGSRGGGQPRGWRLLRTWRRRSPSRAVAIDEGVETGLSNMELWAPGRAHKRKGQGRRQVSPFKKMTSHIFPHRITVNTIYRWFPHMKSPPFLKFWVPQNHPWKWLKQ